MFNTSCPRCGSFSPYYDAESCAVGRRESRVSSMSTCQGSRWIAHHTQYDLLRKSSREHVKQRFRISSFVNSNKIERIAVYSLLFPPSIWLWNTLLILWVWTPYVATVRLLRWSDWSTTHGPYIYLVLVILSPEIIGRPKHSESQIPNAQIDLFG